LEEKKYDEKMDDLLEMEEKARQKQKAEELRTHKRKIRIKRKKEDEEFASVYTRKAGYR
jgi:hypothetical protein